MVMPPLAMPLLNAFLLAIVMIQVLGASAARIGLVDNPKGRKLHDGAVPLTGGIAIFAAFLVPVVYLHFQVDIHWGLVFGLLVLVILGVADDAFDLKPGLKLAGQTGAALIMVLTNDLLIDPAGLIGMPDLDSVGLSLVFTLLFIVGVINAFNMIDGLDGLAGGTAAGALVWIIVATFIAGPAGAVVEPLLVLCAVLGFLLFNVRHPWRKRAAVFMGDAGSMMLGGAIAFFALAAHKTANGPPVAALLWCFALPVFDTLLLIARRLAAGASPLVGDRRHLHHLLLDSGLVSETAAAAIILLISFMLGGLGLLGWQLGASPMTLILGLLVPFAFHGYFVCHGWKTLRTRPGARPADPDRGNNIVTIGPATTTPGFAMEAFKSAEDRR